MIRLNEARGEGLRFRPVERDTFQQGTIRVRFHRDDAGKVVALELTTPGFRKVKFTSADANRS